MEHRVASVRIRNFAAVSLGLCGAVVLSACGDSGGDSKTAMPATAPASSQAPTAASADPQAAQKEAVLQTYTAMWTEQMKAYRKADASGTQLEKYATLDALGQFRNDLARMKQAGTVVRGDLAHYDTKVTALDMRAKTPKATLSDCMDISKWQTYNTKKHQVVPMPSNQPLRYVATAEAQRWNGQWLITAFTPHGNQSC